MVKPEQIFRSVSFCRNTIRPVTGPSQLSIPIAFPLAEHRRRLVRAPSVWLEVMMVRSGLALPARSEMHTVPARL